MLDRVTHASARVAEGLDRLSPAGRQQLRAYLVDRKQRRRRERRCRDSRVECLEARGAGLWSRVQIGEKGLAEDRQPFQPRERARTGEQFEQRRAQSEVTLANDGGENGLLGALVAKIVRDERAEAERLKRHALATHRRRCGADARVLCPRTSACFLEQVDDPNPAVRVLVVRGSQNGDAKMDTLTRVVMDRRRSRVWCSCLCCAGIAWLCLQ